MIKIRKAVSEDAESIVDFQLRMAWETESLRLDRETVSKGVAAVFSDYSKGQYFVAEKDGTVVASLLITYEWSDWRNSNVWWFQSVYVVPDHRRQGVFRKMYLFIRDLAEKNDAAGLRLYVETGNERARSTYESLGMSSEHYAFYQWMRK
ncbi:MAG TPA: GNAT family N-acetyltransferase [Bacteroidales bacterium]|jgi:GNAT superfamily N-acetyltransferase|nr:GNAT family N-acetyltransferase [Bacteroidales bacterium]